VVNVVNSFCLINTNFNSFKQRDALSVMESKSVPEEQKIYLIFEELMNYLKYMN